jgi:hypothetical protein
MKRHLRALRDDRGLADTIARSGLETIRQRHTCAHRVDELLAILALRGTARVRGGLAIREAAE